MAAISVLLRQQKGKNLMSGGAHKTECKDNKANRRREVEGRKRGKEQGERGRETERGKERVRERKSTGRNAERRETIEEMIECSRVA